MSTILHEDPRTLLLPTPVTGWMEHWLIERRNGAIDIRVPQRGELAKLEVYGGF